MTRAAACLPLLLALACGDDGSSGPAAPPSDPPPGIADAPARPVAAADAAPAPAAKTAMPRLPGEDAAYATRSDWARRWAVAINRPPAGAPKNPDWPCAVDFLMGSSSKVELTDTFEYGGPATCMAPPDLILSGCPIGAYHDDTSPPLRTTLQYAYDESGHLVAIRRTNEMRVRRVVVTWDGDRAVGLASDSNDDGEPDEHYRYTYEGDTIRHEEQHSDGSWETVGIYTITGGRAVSKRKPSSEVRYQMAGGGEIVTPKPGSEVKYVWKGARLIEARGFRVGAKKPAERNVYRHDCP